MSFFEKSEQKRIKNIEYVGIHEIYKTRLLITTIFLRTRVLVSSNLYREIKRYCFTVRVPIAKRDLDIN